MLTLALLLLQSAPTAALLARNGGMRAATPAAPDQPAATAPLLHDRAGRPAMAVAINGKGPFPMVVDTAAQTSLMSAALAAEIGMAPLPGGIAVNGATGTGRGRLYPVDTMRNALIDADHVALVELENAGVTDARGIVGMERFEGRKILFDRSAGRIVASPSGPAGPGYATVAGRRTAEGFVEVPVTLDGVAIPALVDTGSAVTIVNEAGFRRLGWAPDDPRITDGGTIRGAAATGTAIRQATIGRLAIGGIVLRNVPLMIAPDPNVPPNIILGTNLLNLFPGFAVDAGRGELQIKLPPRPVVAGPVNSTSNSAPGAGPR